MNYSTDDMRDDRLTDEHFLDPNTVSVPLLMKRLKLSRNYITRHITHAVKHVEVYRSRGSVVLFDKQDLCNWLQTHATFTRQTRRVNLHRMFMIEREKNPDIKFDEFLALPPEIKRLGGLDPRKRSLVPAVPVPSFNFWDKPLIFPKEYRADLSDPESVLLSPEICYRDMFNLGATKIQLGRQKTIFCLEDLDSLDDLPTLRLNDMVRGMNELVNLMPVAWKPYKGWEIPANATTKIRTTYTPARYVNLTTPKSSPISDDKSSILASRSISYSGGSDRLGSYDENEKLDVETDDFVRRQPYRDRHYDITVRSASDTFSSQAVQHALKKGFNIKKVLNAYQDQSTGETVITFKANIHDDIPDQEKVWVPGNTIESEIPMQIERLRQMLKYISDSDREKKKNILDQLEYLCDFAHHIYWNKK